MGLMNLNLDGELTSENVTVPSDGIVTLGHNLFKPEPLTVMYGDEVLTRGQDYIADRADERLYYQKNVTLFTCLRILNENLVNKQIEVHYYACGDYIDADTWNNYPTAESLKQSLQSKVDNTAFKEEVARIDSDIEAEAAARKSADSTLQVNINSEAALRQGEDEKLQGNIDSEAEKRIAADSTLQANIDKEAAARSTADSDIRSELETETDLRLSGDALLQENIDAEAATRETADTTLQTNIDSEAATRESADSALQTKITNEIATRAETDNSLQTQITDLKTKFESFVPGLTYKVVSELPTSDISADVIYLIPAGSQATNQIYEEYIYIDGSWELLGTTATTQAITVDSAISATSTNPVQNKVISAALDGKLDTDATAASAAKLETSAGDSNTPVYFSNGKPVACTSLDLNTTGSAAKLTTGRSISVTDGTNTGDKTLFNGTADISIPLPSTIKAALDGNAATATKANSLTHGNMDGWTEEDDTVANWIAKGTCVWRFTSKQLKGQPSDWGDLLNIVASGSEVKQFFFSSYNGVGDVYQRGIHSSTTEANTYRWYKLSTYTALTELNLDSSATIQNVIDALRAGETCILRTDSFDDLSQFNDIQYGYLYITKTASSMCDIWLREWLGSLRMYYGRQAKGKFNNWVADYNAYTLTEATSSAAGLMSAGDKSKLDGVEEGATKTTIDTNLSPTSKNPATNAAIYSRFLKSRVKVITFTLNTFSLSMVAGDILLIGISVYAGGSLYSDTTNVYVNGTIYSSSISLSAGKFLYLVAKGTATITIQNNGGASGTALYIPNSSGLF